MPGRGRPRKAKSPKTKCSNSTATPEEKLHSYTEKWKPEKKERKEVNHTKKKPSALSTQGEKTTDTRDALRTSTKTCAGGAKSPKSQTAQEMKTTKVPEETKTCAKREISPELSSEVWLETEKDKKKHSVKAVKVETCGGRTKLSEETKHQPKTPKDTTKAAVQGRKAKLMDDKMRHKSPEDHVESDTIDKPDTNSILSNTLEKLKINMNEKSEAAQVINRIVKTIKDHLKNTDCFKEVQDPLNTGSYYENLKISHPDEFDVMLPIPVDRVDIRPFGDDGAFYSVALKRGNSALKKFQPESKSLSGSEMLKEFRKDVIESIKSFPGVAVTRKKKGCPAVTLNITVASAIVSLDVVLSLVVKSSWPLFTSGGLQIDSWLGRKVKKTFKGMPYYLVPKYEGRGTAENNGVLAKDVWRLSFSHVEKEILKNHGSEKTCCEKDGVRCCRKQCLKLLKHLLSLLKDRDSSFDKFCSYHAKTTLLHACCSRTKDTEWAYSSLSHYFQQLLQDFEGYLEHGVLKNFFIPTQNLLSGCSQKSCKSLALRIREEREKGFPIFKERETDDP